MSISPATCTTPSTLSRYVRCARRGLRRTYGSAPRRLARPLSVDEVRQIVDGIDRTTPIGIRDAAMILLSYASALRRSELVALALADVEDKPAGLMLHIRRSKTDPEGHGAIVGVAHGQHAATDPVAALNAWREIRGVAPGPIFTRIWGSTISLQPLTGHVPARMLRARAEAAGLDGTRIAAHSMRPATPPPPRSPAPRSTGSLPRPDTRTSPSSSTGASDLLKPSRHL